MGRASVPVLVKNAEGFYIFANQAAESALGYGPGQIGGMHIGDLSANDPEWLRLEFDRLRAHRVWNGNLLFRCKSGELLNMALNAFVSTSISPGIAYIGMFHPANFETPSPPNPLLPVRRYDLSPDERRLLQLFAEGFSDKDLASILGLADWAVSREAMILLQKMGVTSRTAACVAAIKARVIS